MEFFNEASAWLVRPQQQQRHIPSLAKKVLTYVSPLFSEPSKCVCGVTGSLFALFVDVRSNKDERF